MQDSNDCFVLVVQSELLFKDLPKQGSMTTPRISRQDIGSEYFGFLLWLIVEPAYIQNRVCS
jgi:hypothetical protein